MSVALKIRASIHITLESKLVLLLLLLARVHIVLGPAEALEPTRASLEGVLLTDTAIVEAKLRLCLILKVRSATARFELSLLELVTR